MADPTSPTTVSLPEAAAGVVVDLVERLRAGGVPVSTGEVLDATRALNTVDVNQRRVVHVTLKAALVKDTSHDVLFQRSFDAVFPMARLERPRGDSTGAKSANGGDSDDAVGSLVEALREGDQEQLDAALDDMLDRFARAHAGDQRTAGQHVQQVLRRMNIPQIYQRYVDEAGAETDFEKSVERIEARTALDQMSRRMEDLMSGRLREHTGVDLQALEDIEDRPLLKAGPDELLAMRAAMRPLARRLAARLGAKRRRGTRGLDMRRTIRASMGYGGIPVSPVLRRRHPTKPDLIVLCDVSGSTAQFAPFTLTLLHAIHQEFRRVRSFVFVDGIVEITEILEASPGVLDANLLLGRRGLIAHDGRSDYRRALATFLARWGDAVTAKTTVIIAGDARSHARESAVAQLAELDHRARRLYWLNPEPRHEWDTVDSCASEYANHCTAAFEVSTIRDLIGAVTQIV